MKAYVPTPEEEKHIQKRLDPILADWITKHKVDYPNVGALYELIRNVYLTSLLDYVAADYHTNFKIGETNAESQVNKRTED